MRLAEITPHSFVTVRLPRVGGIVPTDTARVERIDPPRFDGDKARVVVTRWMVKGPTECRFPPRDVVAVVEPEPRVLRFIEAIEAVNRQKAVKRADYISGTVSDANQEERV